MADPFTLLTIASTAFSAVGTLVEGAAAGRTAEFEARQREQQAKEARAVSQREALEKRREQRLLESAQLARAAAVGGASDPSVIDIFADTAERGELAVQTALYAGETQARGLETAAEVRRFEGRQARLASLIGAGTDILSGGAGLYENFGQRRRDRLLESALRARGGSADIPPAYK